MASLFLTVEKKKEIVILNIVIDDSEISGVQEIWSVLVGRSVDSCR